VKGRGTTPNGCRSIVGVLLVGALVAACGSHAPNAAPATASSTSASATSASATTASPASASPISAPVLVTPSPSPSAAAAAVSPSVAATPVALAAGQVGTRAQVPWAQIGAGWFLVLSDSPAVWQGVESAPPSGSVTMLLISPTGARYVITSWSSTGSDPRNLAELDAWSGDGRHVLFGQRGNGAIEMDLTTGALRQISVPQLTTIGFTSPGGSNLVANVDTSTAGGTWTGQRLVRLDLSGKPQVQLAQVLQTELGARPYSGTIGWLYSADGANVYLDGAGGLRVVSNAGGPIRALAMFQTADTDCSPVRWWDHQTILADCNNDSGSRLWLVQATVGSATPLTAVPGSDAVGLGYKDAVHAGGSVFAQHIEGCGVVTVHRLASSGVGTRIKIPQSLSNDQLIGVVGSKLAIRSSTECGSPSWFGFYDPATNTVQKVIPDGPGDLGAGSALAFP
jgi:hypothetical protein